jgi:hypothetical protein
MASNAVAGHPLSCGCSILLLPYSLLPKETTLEEMLVQATILHI